MINFISPRGKKRAIVIGGLSAILAVYGIVEYIKACNPVYIKYQDAWSELGDMTGQLNFYWEIRLRDFKDKFKINRLEAEANSLIKKEDTLKQKLDELKKLPEYTEACKAHNKGVATFFIGGIGLGLIGIGVISNYIEYSDRKRKEEQNAKSST
jgi:hypothetical protein